VPASFLYRSTAAEECAAQPTDSSQEVHVSSLIRPWSFPVALGVLVLGVLATSTAPHAESAQSPDQASFDKGQLLADRALI
jgi:hypothetical protein